MAFRLNKLRDFYLILSKIIKGSKLTDPVDAVLEDRKRFKAFKDQASDKPSLTANKEQQVIAKIVTELLKQDDKRRVMEILRNLNSKQEYALIAQTLLSELLPRFNPEQFLDSYK